MSSTTTTPPQFLRDENGNIIVDEFGNPIIAVPGSSAGGGTVGPGIPPITPPPATTSSNSSGAQVFALDTPTFGDISLYALNRCEVRRTMVTTDHLADAAMAGNLVLSDWSTDQPNLWKVVLLSVPLVQDQTVYTLPRNVLVVMDMFIRTPVGPFGQSDRIIYGVSRTEYDSFPNKQQQAPPTVAWINRTAPIALNLYPAPEQSNYYNLCYHAIVQYDDAALPGAATLDIPYRMLKAFVDALVAELSLTYLPDKAQLYNGVATVSKRRADASDREDVPLMIVPSIGRYWSRY